MRNLYDLLDGDDIESQKNEIAFALTTIKKEVENDPSCVDAFSLVNKMLINLDNKVISKDELQKDYELLLGEFYKLLNNSSKETINAKFKRLNKIFIGNMDFLVQSNVLPEYQSTVKRLFYKWALLLSNEGSSEESIDEALKLAVSKMLEHHVLTNPAQLLTYSVKKAQAYKEKNNDDELSINVLEGLKNCLILAYQKVNRVRLEYKMMSLASKGFATKTRDFLNGVTLIGAEKHKFLEGDGMNRIRNVLSDPTNNNSTLLMFVEQTGLEKDLLESIYNEDLSMIKKYVRNISSDYVATIKTSAFLKAMFNIVLENTQDKQNFSKEDLIEFFKDYEKIMKEQDLSKKMKVKTEKYVDRINEILKTFELPKNTSMKNILASLNEEGLTIFEFELREKEQYFNSVLSKLYSDINLLNSMKKIENDADIERKYAHVCKINEVLRYSTRCMNFLVNLRDGQYSVDVDIS